MSRDLRTDVERRLVVLDDVAAMLQRALDLLDAVDAGTVAGPEIDMALHHIREEQDRVRAGTDN